MERRSNNYVPSNFFPMMPKIESKKEDKEVEELQCLFIEGREVKESDDVETSVVSCIDNENSSKAMGCQNDEKVDFEACVDDKLMGEMVDNMVDEPLVMNSLYGDLEHAICSNGHSLCVDTMEEGMVGMAVQDADILSSHCENLLGLGYALLDCNKEDVLVVECME